MLNTECKQCHKKWHHDNAKYCSMCGKKLVDEPESEFNIGDYIATKRYIGVISRVDKIPNNYDDYELNTICGVFYDKWCETMGNTRLFPDIYLGSDRVPTKEEIAEYEAALNFHKHGRKPFELKWGDMFIDGNSNRRIVVNSNLYTNGMFYKSGYKLLATVEEVNEWLGVADE